MNWDDTVMLSYSSGTTGLPKIIPCSHRYFVTLAMAAFKYPEVRQIRESGNFLDCLY